MSMRFTPAFRASEDWRASRALKAMWRETREEEQAVSTVTAGPLRRMVYETRPAPRGSGGAQGELSTR